MKGYFKKREIFLWLFSCILIVGSFFAFGADGYLTLAASLIGVTAIILNAKGNPLGQALMVAFSVMYGVISYGFAYYGEMITYVGMTGPMALFALISWLKNPYNGKRSQVKVQVLGKTEWVIMWLLAAAVTFVFYYILKYFHTANLALSTLSVTTSFVSVYLTFRRNPYFSLGYAANDVVLIVLWLLAAADYKPYYSVAVCFAAFLANDVYGFFSWRKMQKKQAAKG